MSRSHRIAALFAVSTLCVVGLADAKLSRVANEAASANFHASGPAGMAIDGKTTDVTVGDDGTTVTVVVGLKDIATGVKLRDEHTRDKYLEVGKFPSATLAVPRASLSFPAEGATSSGDASGTITIHGQTQPVKFHYTAKKSGGAITIDGTAPIDITTFGINVPSYLGVTVKKDVTVGVHVVATDA